MVTLDTKSAGAAQLPTPREDEESLTLHTDWTLEEEAKAKRKSVEKLQLLTIRALTDEFPF